MKKTMRTIITAIFVALLPFHFAGCSLFSSSSEEETSVDDPSAAEEETLDGDAASDEETPADEAVADGGEELPADESLDSAVDGGSEEEAFADSSKTQEAPAEELAPPADTSSEVAAEPPPAPTETPADNSSEVAAAPTDTGSSDAGVDLGGASGSMDTAQVDEPKPAPAPLRKVEAQPFRRNGMLLNGVYLARPGDSYDSISKTIYGDESRAEDLKKANPYFKSPRPGDKIYYNSAKRPEDSTRMLTFFEESGSAPEVYVSQEGDDLKKVSEKLLGYPGAWKEVWATNTVESKDSLDAGTELRYWKSASAGTPTSSASEIAASAAPEEVIPPPQQELPPPPPAEELPPPPAADLAQTPPPPPVEELPPPPPPPAELAPPPPPMPAIAAGEDAAATGELSEDDMMMLGGGAILALGVVGFIIARRKRQQNQMASFSDTQVGT